MKARNLLQSNQNVMITSLKYQSPGWYAIGSGIIGAIAFGFLVTYLKVREENFSQSIFYLRFHDAGVILQFLFLIPAVLLLHRLLQTYSSTIHKTGMKIAIGSIIFTSLFILLTIPKILSDVLYLFPQGIFGLWLVFINWRMKGILSNRLRWFGIVVGVGHVRVFPSWICDFC